MEEKNYFKLILFVVGTLGAFAVAIMAFYFSIVGLTVGSAIIEGDVLAPYKYECANNNETQSTCTIYNTSQTTNAYDNYLELSTGGINLIGTFLGAIGIVFTFIGFVLLFAVLKQTGIMKTKNMNRFE